MDRNNKLLYKRMMANTSAIWQNAAHSTDQLSSCCEKKQQQQPSPKSLSLNEKYWILGGGGGRGENGPEGRRKEEKTERAMEEGKNKRGDSKVESNDSPEITDRWET